eukprot:gene7549-8386_t
MSDPFTIGEDRERGGKWCIFKSARAGLLTVRNYGTESSVLNVWAPPNAIGYSVDGQDREATLSLVRAMNDEKESEFIDIYNQDYGSCGREAGIRIQKRGQKTQYPCFKIEFSDDGKKMHEAMRFIGPKGNDDQTNIEIRCPVTMQQGGKLSGLVMPEKNDDAVSKSYVDQKVNCISIYKLSSKEDFMPVPVMENQFFTLSPCGDQGIWQGTLMPGFYKFNLSFVIGNPTESDPRYIVLKLDDKTILCQKIRNEELESNFINCWLEVEKEKSAFSVQFKRQVQTDHAEKSIEFKGIQRESFLLEMAEIKPNSLICQT